QHIDVICDPLPRDVECCTVINRNAVDWKPEGHIHCSIEGNQLDWDMSLIMVLRHNEVKSPLIRFMIDRIGRNRARYVDAFCSGHGNTRRSLKVVLVPEQATFSTMRVDT